jgi:hypothetical protein
MMRQPILYVPVCGDEVHILLNPTICNGLNSATQHTATTSESVPNEDR